MDNPEKPTSNRRALLMKLGIGAAAIGAASVASPSTAKAQGCEGGESGSFYIKSEGEYVAGTLSLSLPNGWSKIEFATAGNKGFEKGFEFAEKLQWWAVSSPMCW